MLGHHSMAHRCSLHLEKMFDITVHVIHMLLQHRQGDALMPQIQQSYCLHRMLYMPRPDILQQLQSVHGHVTGAELLAVCACAGRRNTILTQHHLAVK